MSPHRARSLVAFAAAGLVLFAVGPNFTNPASSRGSPAITVSSLRGRSPLDSATQFDARAAVESWNTQAVAGLAAFALCVGVMVGAATPASANEAKMVGQIAASGLIFKDTINLEAITDPKVAGVTLYQSDFSKSSFDQLKAGPGGLFDSPGASGLSCVSNGKVLVKSDISKDKAGEEVYSENKAFLGKTLKIKRVYDEGNKNVIYVVYTERLNKDDDKNGSRFKSQLCAIHVDGTQ